MLLYDGSSFFSKPGRWVAMRNGAGLQGQLDFKKVSLGRILRVDGEGGNVFRNQLYNTFTLDVREAFIRVDGDAVGKFALFRREGEVVIDVTIRLNSVGVEIAPDPILRIKEGNR